MLSSLGATCGVTSMAVTDIHIAQSRAAERTFFSGIALALALTVFAGFAPTYYFRSAPLPPLTALYQFHGFLFTSWLALFVVQTVFIAAGRTDLHRQFGVAGAILASMMVIVGFTVAVEALRRGSAPPGIDPRAFFSLPIADILIFAILVAMAVMWRRYSEAHKRLMLLGTISLITAAVARFIVAVAGPQTSPLGLLAGTDAFVVALFAFDLLCRRRIHWATWFGGLLVIFGKPAFVGFGFLPFGSVSLIPSDESDRRRATWGFSIYSDMRTEDATSPVAPTFEARCDAEVPDRRDAPSGMTTLV